MQWTFIAKFTLPPVNLAHKMNVLVEQRVFFLQFFDRLLSPCSKNFTLKNPILYYFSCCWDSTAEEHLSNTFEVDGVRSYTEESERLRRSNSRRKRRNEELDRTHNTTKKCKKKYHAHIYFFIKFSSLFGSCSCCCCRLCARTTCFRRLGAFTAEIVSLLSSNFGNLV